jgi:WD40 repeat protein
MNGELLTEDYYAYGEVSCVKFSPDHKSVIAATADGSLLCYDFMCGKS